MPDPRCLIYKMYKCGFINYIKKNNKVNISQGEQINLVGIKIALVRNRKGGNLIMKFLEELVQMQLQNIPKEVEMTVKRSLVDFFGVSLAALNEPTYEKVVAYVKETSKGEVPLLGTDFRGSASQVALSLGTLGHAIDYDDISTIMIGHPTVVLAPVILSLGYEQKASGKDLLEAYIAGYEAIGRISSIAALNQYTRGFHTTATIGIIGATISAARLLNLNEKQIQAAIGMACSFASGVRANFGTMTKPLHAGQAAGNAIFAAKMAKMNFESSQFAFSGENSYLSALSERVDFDFQDDQLFIEGGLIIKPYPTCGFTTRAIDSAINIRKVNHFDLGEIDSIVCHVTPMMPKVLKYSNPQYGLEAKFSLEYCVAQALISGTLKIEHFTNEYLKRNPQFKELIPKISWEIIEEFKKGVDFGQEYFKLSIKLKDGTLLESITFDPKGYPNNPLTEEEFQQKFVDCSRLALTEKQRLPVYHALMNFTQQEDISVLLDDIYDQVYQNMGKKMMHN